MAIAKFPPLEMADQHGLLAVGGDLEIESLLLAYRSGIFPWPISPFRPMAWFSPDPRGILEFNNIHISNSLSKIIKKNEFEITFNQAFSEVISLCAKANNRKGPDGEKAFGTWITEELMEAYIHFHYHGHAYSVEVWKDEKLAGGLYGVLINGYASGESMFYNVSNASKIALIALMRQLKAHGIHWLDTQMRTPVVAQLGGVEIPRSLFIEKLQESLTPIPGRTIHTVFKKLKAETL